MSSAEQHLPAELRKIIRIKNPRVKVEKLEAYLEWHPDEIHVLWYLAELEMENRQYSKAREHLKRLTEEAPELEEAHLMYAGLLADVFGERHEARQYYEKALEINPVNVVALIDMAYLLSHHMGEYGAAENLYERAAQAEPDNHDIYRSLASMQYHYLQDYNNARRNLEKALKLKPDDAFYHYLLAVIYSEKLRDFEQATFHYMKAIELNPNLSDARGHLRKMDIIKNKTFISNIAIKQIAHLENMEIPISNEQARHLMLTGKNGSGKTRMLTACRDYLQKILTISTDYLFSEKGLQEFKDPHGYNLKFHVKENLLDLRFKYETGNFIVAYFPARRDLHLLPEETLRNINIPEVTGLEDKISERLIAFLWNIKAQALLALEKGNKEEHERKEKRIKHFTDKLKDIDERIVELKFTSDKGYDIQVIPRKPYKPFTFAQLADGYASVFHIIAELILRMQHKVQDTFDLEGIVMIDEPEAHLHIDMQKRVMPIFNGLFPNVQFLVATHSPFILNSLRDSVIYDLAYNIRLEDASAYAYDGLVETYFGADKYSRTIKDRLLRYRKLSAKSGLSPAEQREMQHLEHYFENIPAFVSQELIAEFQRVKLRNLSQQNDPY